MSDIIIHNLRQIVSITFSVFLLSLIRSESFNSSSPRAFTPVVIPDVFIYKHDFNQHQFVWLLPIIIRDPVTQYPGADEKKREGEWDKDVSVSWICVMTASGFSHLDWILSKQCLLSHVFSRKDPSLPPALHLFQSLYLISEGLFSLSSSDLTDRDSPRRDAVRVSLSDQLSSGNKHAVIVFFICGALKQMC